jgi:hypothetical protein
MTLTRIAKFAGAPAGFNHAAAGVVFDRIMAQPDDETAALYAAMLLGGALQADLLAHEGVIAKALDAHYTDKAARLRRELARTAVAKSRAGEDPRPQIVALEALVKARGKDRFDRDVRGRFADREERTLANGGFAVDHARIRTNDKLKPLRNPHARQFGIPGTDLKGEDRAHFQQAFQQVADMVAPYARSGQDALVHLDFQRKGEDQIDTQLVAPRKIEGALKGMQPGDRLVSASVSVVPRLSASGAAYDALATLGAPGAGAVLAGTMEHGAGNTKRLGEFGTEWNRPYVDQNEAYVPSTRLFNRLAAGSRLLDDSLGDVAPKKLQLALKVGAHVGEFGPEAQKVIGPAADKAAYRYRGTERSPDSRLTTGLEAIRRAPHLTTGKAKRDYLIHGSTDEQANWSPSPTLAYFRSRLPKAELNTLQRKSGTIPPSEGVIFDRQGRLATQASGYGDDWYLPFNLKNLKALKGGEYVRTRTFGGPTTEDVYTGLIAGARAVTVVSHNGTYTVEFDDTLRGGRRFNDKAARMVGRYGHLLDAVKNGKITTGGIDPSRLDELAAKAAKLYPPDRDPGRYETELNRLKTNERRDPVLSQAQAGAATAEFFNELAANHKTADGHDMNGAELAEDFATRQALSQLGQQDYFRAMPADKRGPLVRQYKERIYAQLIDEDPVKAGQNLADAMGVRPKLNAHLERAKVTNKANLKELELNGPGYLAALEALKEQFPYYIADVKYHPWTDATNGRDTGYVKPRHTRPEKALAGYFDPDVTGHGKVTADSTRWQNFPVRGGRLNFVGKPADQVQAATAAAARTGGESGARTEPITPESAKRMREDADLQLLSAIREATHFGDNVVGTTDFPQLHALKTRAITNDLLDNLKDPKLAPAFTGIRLMSDTDVMAMFNEQPEKMHRELVKAKDELKTLGLLNLPHGLLRTFENDGKPVAAAKLGDARAMLRNPNAEYDLPERPFLEEHEAPSRDVEQAYRDDGQIEALVQAGHLPAEVHDPDFITRSRTLHGKLLDAERTWHHFDTTPGAAHPRTEIERAEIEPYTLALIRANQLKRRHGEAIGRETDVITQQAAEAAAAAPPPPQVENHLHLTDNMAEALRLFQQAIDPNSPEP